VKVRDVMAAIEQLAPAELAYDWDKAGLAIGDPDAVVSRVFVALSVTPETLQKARKVDAQMIVAHHPPIWSPLTALRTDDPNTKLCLDIAKAEIAVFSAHTNLDVVPGGVNHVLARRLDLQRIAPLIPVAHARQVKLVTFVPEADLAAVREAVCGAGAGVIGEYTHCSFSTPGTGTFWPGDAANPHLGKKDRLNQEPEHRFETLVSEARLGAVIEALMKAHPYEEVAYDVVPLDNNDPSISLGLRGEIERPITLRTFAARTREALGVSHVRYNGDPRRKVHRVGVLGGAGGGSVEELPQDIDVFVTGDVKYHDALTAEMKGLAVIDAGHHGTEKWIVPELSAYLKRTLKDLKVSSYMEPEPFRVVTK